MFSVGIYNLRPQEFMLILNITFTIHIHGNNSQELASFVYDGECNIKY